MSRPPEEQLCTRCRHFGRAADFPRAAKHEGPVDDRHFCRCRACFLYARDITGIGITKCAEFEEL